MIAAQEAERAKFVVEKARGGQAQHHHPSEGARLVVCLEIDCVYIFMYVCLVCFRRKLRR